MSRLSLFRLALIALIAVFSGPRSAMAAAGEWVVICGADGGATAVLYDFSAGAPAEAEFAFERCDLCLACDMAATAPSDARQRPGAFGHALAAPLPTDLRAHAAPPASARAPPVPV